MIFSKKKWFLINWLRRGLVPKIFKAEITFTCVLKKMGHKPSNGLWTEPLTSILSDLNGSHLKIFRGGNEKWEKRHFFAKNPSPRHFCEGKFFRDRIMLKLRSWGFWNCGTFWACELFNGSYCCSKSTDFEISGPSPKIRGVKKDTVTILSFRVWNE